MDRLAGVLALGGREEDSGHEIIVSIKGMGRYESLLIEERYEANVDRSGECHLWLAYRDRKGYGIFWGGEYYPGTRYAKKVKAHRWGYEHYIGPIPEGMLVCHTCDNPPCQNRDHWFLGTKADNNADMVAKGRQYRGERHHASKLTEDDVREIRRRFAQGETQTAIAADYGVSGVNVGSIVRRAIWREV